MDQSNPKANLDVSPVIPPPANEATPHGHVQTANTPPTSGFKKPEPSPRRNRTPKSPVPHAQSPHAPGAPALLELAAVHPFNTNQRRLPNTFTPDAQMLFHALGICDQMMCSTERFIRCTPSWMPIVSQLYMSILWLVMILKVYVTSGYGAMHSQLYDDLVRYLHIEECMIPGPLVPFFQSLSAINGPFEWMGDILPSFPSFHQAWNATNFAPRDNFARILPIPAIMLDQLYYFATWIAGANQSLTRDFEWYRNIFSVGQGAYNNNHRLLPQHCGSIFLPTSQIEAARSFWNTALQGSITRTNSAAGETVFSNFLQLFGFIAQDGAIQVDWFQHVTTTMSTYCKFFNGSIPLRSIKATGTGAVAVHGKVRFSGSVRNWIYPGTTAAFAFRITRYLPAREIPNNLAVCFQHADHELEEQAEQFAILAHTNIDWISNYATQHNWTQLTTVNVRSGDYWNLLTHRSNRDVNIKNQLAQIISSRYHQLSANLAD